MSKAIDCFRNEAINLHKNFSMSKLNEDFRGKKISCIELLVTGQNAPQVAIHKEILIRQKKAYSPETTIAGASRASVKVTLKKLYYTGKVEVV